MKDKALVHACCAPCATYCFEKLTSDGWDVTGYFYNPNIHPEKEYNIRKNELFRLYSNVILEEDSVEVWHDSVKGFDQEKEGGKRCEICFKLRLEKAAIYAKDNGYDAFTTVLTVSPHKNSTVINQIGLKLAEKYGIRFIEEDFKKNNGFKRAMELSKQYDLYRQSYCGCVYSIRK